MAGSLVLSSRNAHTQDTQNSSEDQPCVQPNPAAQLRSFGAGPRSQIIERCVQSQWIHSILCRFARLLQDYIILSAANSGARNNSAEARSRQIVTFALRLNECSEKAIAFKLPGNMEQ